MQVLRLSSRVLAVAAALLASCCVAHAETAPGLRVLPGQIALHNRSPRVALPNSPARTALPIAGWSLISAGAEPTRALQSEPAIDLLCQLMIDADPLVFAAPVLIDDTGARAIPMQSILIAFQPVCAQQEQHRIVSTLIDAPLAPIAPGSRIRRIDTSFRNAFDVLALADALASDPRVRFAHPEYIHLATKSLIPNDPLFVQDWSLRNTGQSGGTPGIDLGASAAWDTTIGSPDVRIVILDDGVQQSHPDINQIPGGDFTFSPSAQDDGRPVELCDSHGTRVAGRVSARINNAIGGSGVAPGCTVMSARVFVSDEPPCSNTGVVQDTWLINALLWASHNGARITNTSLKIAFSPAVEEAYEEARNAGMLHFASSGNAGFETVDYPARYPSVISVGSIDHNANIASSSNRGPNLDLVAPGVNVITTDPSGSAGSDPGDYDVVSGTSYAAPGAAGVAALAASSFAYLSPDILRDALAASALDLGAPGRDNTFGAGLVRAPDTINALPQPSDAYFVGLARPTADSPFSRAQNIARDASVVVGEMSTQFPVLFYRTRSSALLTASPSSSDPVTGIASAAADNAAAIVGRYDAPLGDRAFIYEPGGVLNDLGVLAPIPAAQSLANDCNTDASVVVGASTDANADTQAFRWTDEQGMLPIGFLDATSPRSSEGIATDASGDTVVGVSSSTSGEHAFIWNRFDGMRSLITPGTKGIASSRAEDISSDGLVVVGRVETPGATLAARWTAPGVFETLADLDGGTTFSAALSTNRDASVIVGVASDESGFRAFIWTENDGLRALDEYANTELGIDLGGWRLLAARGISDDAHTIVGEGFNPRGEPEAWLLRLPALPGAFELLTPAQDATGISPSPFFQWLPSPDADLYELQADDDPTFTSPEIAVQTALTSIDIQSAPLEQASRYYWRVNAINEAGETMSPVRTFVTQGNPPPAPLLVLPVPGAIVDTPTPEFLWIPSTGAQSYTLSISAIDAPRAIIYSNQIEPQPEAIQRFTLPPDILTIPGEYTWNITANNAVGSTASSPATSAFTFAPPAPCTADADQSGAVDVEDLVYVLARVGTATPSRADTNSDSVIDVNDISFIIFRLGPCP